MKIFLTLQIFFVILAVFYKIPSAKSYWFFPQLVAKFYNLLKKLYQIASSINVPLGVSENFWFPIQRRWALPNAAPNRIDPAYIGPPQLVLLYDKSRILIELNNNGLRVFPNLLIGPIAFLLIKWKICRVQLAIKAQKSLRD